MSVWHLENFPSFPPLDQDITPDVVVVGGGLSGVLTAYFLQQKGAKVALIEAAKLGSGTSSKSTAKISSNQGCYQKIAKLYGIKYAEEYYRMQQDAAKTYASLIQDLSIDCDFSPTKASLFYNDEEKYKKEWGTLAAFACPKTVSHPLFPNADGILLEENEFLFHPMKFLSALLPSLTVYENTRALSVDASAGVVETKNHTIRAKTVVIATRYPIIDFPGWYFAKLWQETSYLFFAEKFQIKVDSALLGDHPPYLTARPFMGGVISGGFDERTGTGSHAQKKLQAYIDATGATAVNRWCAEDAMSFDSIPYAGKIGDDPIYVMTGYNKWGMTNAMACAKTVASLIAGETLPFAELLSPHRFKLLKTPKSFIKNMAISTSAILKTPFHLPLRKGENLKKGEGRVVLIKGRKRAAYRDEKGALHLMKAKCPHMGGELHFNPASGLWECPCHGSRFTVDGKLVDSPSKFDTQNFPSS